MRLLDKVAIITGAASGIGKATALQFSKEGATVVIADLPTSPGEEVVREIEASGGRAKFIPCDVTSAESMNHLAEETFGTFGKIDIMYNNAGLGTKSTPIEEVTDEYFDRVMKVNLKGVFLGTRAVVPYMKRAGKGVIISTGSTGAVRARPENGVYGATKGAVVVFSKSLALELAPFGIRVNVIHPAITNTPLADPDHLKYYAEENIIPLGRITEPIDIARAVSFIASDEASMITGVELEVDGGRCI